MFSVRSDSGFESSVPAAFKSYAPGRGYSVKNTMTNFRKRKNRIKSYDTRLRGVSALTAGVVRRSSRIQIQPACSGLAWAFAIPSATFPNNRNRRPYYAVPKVPWRGRFKILTYPRNRREERTATPYAAQVFSESFENGLVAQWWRAPLFVYVWTGNNIAWYRLAKNYKYKYCHWRMYIFGVTYGREII